MLTFGLTEFIYSEIPQSSNDQFAQLKNSYLKTTE